MIWVQSEKRDKYFTPNFTGLRFYEKYANLSGYIQEVVAKGGKATMVMPPNPPDDKFVTPPQNTTRVKTEKSSPAPDDENEVQVLDVLRELRAEIQDLQSVLKQVRQGDVSLSSNAGYIKKTMNDIAQIMEMLATGRYGSYADSIRHFQNLWEQMNISPVLSDPKSAFSPQDQERYLNSLESLFKTFVFDIGYLTIPDRVNAWMKSSSSGYYVPFHDVFEDELPDVADRTKLLNVLYYQPKLIDGGLVEPDTGLIYRYSLRLVNRIIHYLIIAGAIILAIGIVVAAAYAPIEGWPLKSSDLSMLLIGWLAVAAGLIVHIMVGVAKRMQSQERPPIMAIGQIPLLLDAKCGQVLFKILLTVVGFLGLIFAAGIENAKFMNAFLIGYSLDSVIELLSASLDQKAGSRVSALKQQLGLTK